MHIHTKILKIKGEKSIHNVTVHERKKQIKYKIRQSTFLPKFVHFGMDLS